MNNLEWWIARIEDWARSRNLDFYNQEFILASQDQMLEHMAHYGGYQLYPHWRFGKSFFVNQYLLQKQFFFLPYEIVINTDPSRAYLLDTNALYKNIVTVGHVFAHSDFFRHNRAYKKTDASTIDIRLRKSAEVIERHSKNPAIGIDRVESVIEAGHSIMFAQTDEGTLLEYILKKAHWLPDWKKEVLKAVQETARHLGPAFQTRIMNEGWATYWHYQMLQDLKKELKKRLSRPSFDANLRSRQFHLRVVDIPKKSSEINPYRVGLCVWEKIAKDHGEKFIFDVRAEKTDLSFLLDYFCDQYDLIYKWFVRWTAEEEIPLEERKLYCSEYQEHVLNSVRDSSHPSFEVFMERVGEKTNLGLNHRFQNKCLKMSHVDGILRLIFRLWGSPVVLKTKLKNEFTKDNQKCVEIRDVIFTCFDERKELKVDRK